MIRTYGHLEVKVFKFDYSVDYLPYYKTYMIDYEKEDCIYDVLNKINDIETLSYDSKEQCNIKVNNYFLPANVLVIDVVNRVGSELQIEPISLYRVTNDLVINAKDYEEKLSLFDQYLSFEQKESYKEKYKLEYYSSISMLVNKDYIGDHCLLIANEILIQNSTLEKEILQILTNKDTGILYHTSLKTRLFENRYDVESVFENLLSKMSEYKRITKRDVTKSIVNIDMKINQYFKGFNIALYNQEGCLFKTVIEKSRATYIRLERKRYDIALYSSLANSEFTLKIAGEILLEAKDKNADFLIVKDKSDLAVFDAQQSKIEKVVNREINLPVITQSQFEQLLEGEKNIQKLGFKSHRVKIELLEK